MLSDTEITCIAKIALRTFAWFLETAQNAFLATTI